MRRDPTVQDLHHSDIITYALTRLAGQYAREKQEILRDLKNYKSAESPGGARLGGHALPGAGAPSVPLSGGPTVPANRSPEAPRAF
jgi:hypothetical protein